ncbi:site-specific integrase [Microbacterium schleiferi]|uniref:Site-specific integrase n=1 Tax=Microbacterium schleiferi TaxID=69362 RepID=A0A7S8MUK7_9MICO|nr:site-specific integrase [Microbacterium schleiferi]
MSAYASAPDCASAWRRASSPTVYLLGMGMRRGEVLGARWSDVDLAAGTVTVRRTRVLVGDQVVTTTPKSARSRRTVPLTPEARRALAPTRERTLGSSNVVPIGDHRGADDRLVAIDAAGEPITPWGFRREVLALMATAGVPVIRVHDIRHSVATIMLEAGQPPHVVARILGHDPAVLMRTYPHVGDASAAGAVAALGQAIAGG